MKLPDIFTRAPEKVRMKAEDTLEEFPLEHPFMLFIQRIKKVEADIDTVKGIPREYVNTAALLHSYRLAFGPAGLATNSIGYRIKHIKPEEFPDDFFVFNETGHPRNTQYFINRLNRELLKRIYFPPVDHELETLLEQTILFEQELKTFKEFEDDAEEDF